MPSPIVQLLHRVAGDSDARGCPDQELLRRFVADRDGAAFEALAHRHGPMVLDVCRSVLGNGADAEDAFQATFLVLVKKAGSVRKAASLASWLHGVARRTALKARAKSARHHRQGAREEERGVVDPDTLSWAELRRVLHEELGQLPVVSREPLVLCYLEGRTQDEAAARLGLSKGTLKRRLERGRTLLRARLVRRGLGPAGVLLVATWPAGAAAALPPAMVSSTIQVAAAAASGSSAAPVVSAEVAALTEGVLRAMLVSKLKVAVAVVLVLGLVATGASALAWRAAAARADQPPAAEKPVEAPAAQKPEGVKVKEAFTAWAKEVNGLQAGLGFRSGEKRAYGQGETVKVVLRVRNVTKEAVEFKYIRAFFVENPPTITDADGQTIKQRKLAAPGKTHPLQSTKIGPGKEVDLYEWEFELRPIGEGGTIQGTGKFVLRCERVVGPTTLSNLNQEDPDPALAELATGKLELEVNDKTPAAATKK